MNRPRPLSPHLQIYKFQYTMVLSIAHRITGLLLSLGSLLLAYWLWALASGEEAYARAMQCLSSGWVKVALAGLAFCFFYHLCNGVRHLAWDLGYGYERHEARATGWAVVIASLVFTGIAFWMIFRMGARGMGGAV